MTLWDKFAGLLLSLLLIASCSSPDVERAKLEHKSAVMQRDAARYERDQLRADASRLRQEVLELGIKAEGGQPQYLVKIKVSQSRVSLDLMAHAKDAMNAFEIEIPVSKEFFDHLEEGQQIAKEFRGGSFLVRGSFSSWKLECTGKRVAK